MQHISSPLLHDWLCTQDIGSLKIIRKRAAILQILLAFFLHNRIFARALSYIHLLIIGVNEIC